MKRITILLSLLMLSYLSAEIVSEESKTLAQKMSETRIPILNMSDLTIPEAVVHMQEAYEKETGQLIPIFLSPKAASRSNKINMSAKELSFDRILQFFCSGRTANLIYDVEGNAIYIRVPFNDCRIPGEKIEPVDAANASNAARVNLNQSARIR